MQIVNIRAASLSHSHEAQVRRIVKHLRIVGITLVLTLGTLVARGQGSNSVTMPSPSSRNQETTGEGKPTMDYEGAMVAARVALQKADYQAALTSVEQALQEKPVDAAAIILREDVREQMVQAKTLTEKAKSEQSAYLAAMTKVREAFDRQDYTNAVAAAEAVLMIRPNDSAALQLKAKALLRQNPKQRQNLEQFEVLLVQFGILPSSRAQSGAARRAQPIRVQVSQQFIEQALNQTKKLESEFRAAGQLDPEQKKQFDALGQAIQNWNH